MALPPADANPGVTGGDQPSSEPSPAANDAQQAATPFSAPEASGGKAPQDMVPRGLLDRLTQKMEGQQAELDNLRAQLAEPQRPGYAEEAVKLQREAAKYAVSDPDKMVELLSQASSLQAQAHASDTVEKLLTQQTQQAQLAQHQAATEQAWQQAVRDYPELNDQNSDFYKSAFEVWQSDPMREQDPSSMYKAAVMANEKRLRAGRSQPPALEGGSAPTDLTERGTKSYAEVKQDTLAQMRQRGGVQGLAELLAPNFEDVLTKPNR